MKESIAKIEVATSIIYGNYQALKPAATKINNFLKSQWSQICEDFNLPQFITIKIRPIKGNWSGWARMTGDGFGGQKYSIEVDPRSKGFLTTLFHELTHIDQYTTKRLRTENGTRIWLGQPTNAIKPSTIGYSARKLQEYREQPWEVEANERGAEMSAKYAPAFERIQNTYLIK